MRFALPTRYSDYDSKGHVNNAVYLTYFEIGRVQAWQAVGGDPDANFILADARVIFRSPAMIGEPLAIEVATSEIRTKAWVWSYRIVDERDERLIAEGSTTQVMYDYTTHRSVPIPSEVRDALSRI